MSRASTRTPAATLAALVLACLLPTTPAQAADDGTCVGKGEYSRIKTGMTIDKLGKVLHGQLPFADTDGKGKQRYRWYVACEEDWQPDLDVSVRYHQPVVGRRRPLACRSLMARRNLSRWRSAAPPRLGKREKLNHRRRYRALSSRKDARSSPAFRLDLEGWKRFAPVAEQAGIELALISFSCFEADPMLISCALGRSVEKLKFIVAYRSESSKPTTFVQQFNTLSTLVNGRVA